MEARGGLGLGRGKEREEREKGGEISKKRFVGKTKEIGGRTPGL